MGKIKYKNCIIPLISIAMFYIFLRLIGITTTCYFKSITGIPCPGCGLTRAYLSLLHGDIKKALFYHPLFILPIILCIYIVIFKLKKIKCSNKFLGFIFIMFIVLWIVRMILFFPNKEPMNFDRNTLFTKIITQVFKFNILK